MGAALATPAMVAAVMPNYRLVLPQLSLTFFQLFCSFFVTENAVIDVTAQKNGN